MLPALSARSFISASTRGHRLLWRGDMPNVSLDMPLQNRLLKYRKREKLRRNFQQNIESVRDSPRTENPSRTMFPCSGEHPNLMRSPLLALTSYRFVLTSQQILIKFFIMFLCFLDTGSPVTLTTFHIDTR